MIAPGGSVSAGQAVMELETDKAVVEVPSSVSGTVQEIRVKEGQKIKVGQVIFTVENGAGAKKSPQVASQVPAGEPETDERANPEKTLDKVASESPRQEAAPARPAGRRATDGAGGRSEFTLP